MKARRAAEMKRYVAISLYLFVCFLVVLIYEASQSPAKEASILTIGIALAKALVPGQVHPDR